MLAAHSFRSAASHQLIHIAMAQHTVSRIGQGGTLTLPQAAMLFEETRNDAVGRVVKAHDERDELGAAFEKLLWVHGCIVPPCHPMMPLLRDNLGMSTEVMPPLIITPLGRYRHYKGMEYDVVGTVRHSETLEPLTLYRALYGEHGLWVRPAAMFNEDVVVDGVQQPRFRRIA